MSRAHADALAEAGRLREIVQEIASCGYFDPDPEYKRIRYVEVQIDRSTMEAINECLTSTPTTAEWVEARDKAIRESLEKEVTELRKELAAVREVEESQDRGLAAIYATVEKAIGRRCWHSQMEAVEDLAGRYDALCAHVERLRAASEGMAIGGNHLASALIHILGTGTDKFPPYETEIKRAQEIISDPIKSDLWIYWAVMMRERDALAATPAQSLASVKAEALREVAEKLNGDGHEANDYYRRWLLAEADRLHAAIDAAREGK